MEIKLCFQVVLMLRVLQSVSELVALHVSLVLLYHYVHVLNHERLSVVCIIVNSQSPRSPKWRTFLFHIC